MFKYGDKFIQLSECFRSQNMCGLDTWVLKWFLNNESGLMRKENNLSHNYLKISFYLNCFVLCAIISRNSTQHPGAFLCMFFIGFLTIKCHFKLMHQFMLEHPCRKIGCRFHFSGLVWKIEEADLLHLIVCQMALWLLGKKRSFLYSLRDDFCSSRHEICFFWYCSKS